MRLPLEDTRAEWLGCEATLGGHPGPNGLGVRLPLDECVPPEQITLEVKKAEIEADMVVKLPCGCGQCGTL